MTTSKAATVTAYLAELAEDRRAAIEQVRGFILKHLPKGFVETMQCGMISYVIPLEHYPKTYNGQALTIVSLGSQKNYMSVYLMGIYWSTNNRTTFEKAYTAEGKKLDAGKSCIRFKKVEDLNLKVIGDTIAKISVKDFIEIYENSRKR